MRCIRRGHVGPIAWGKGRNGRIRGVGGHSALELVVCGLLCGALRALNGWEEER